MVSEQKREERRPCFSIERGLLETHCDSDEGECANEDGCSDHVNALCTAVSGGGGRRGRSRGRMGSTAGGSTRRAQLSSGSRDRWSCVDALY